VRGGRPLASIAAFGFAILAELASVALVLGSDSERSGVRWWLVLAPLVLAALPVMVPRPGVRFGAVVGLAAWAVLAAASIGLLFLPATVAALVAASGAHGGDVRLKSDIRGTARSTA